MHFFKLVIDEEGPSPLWDHHWAGGPELYRKTGQESHDEQVSKQHPSMAIHEFQVPAIFEFLSRLS